jgi:hypothetical protein
VNYLLMIKERLSSVGAEVLLSENGIPLYLKKVVVASFRPLGWPPEHICPTRENLTKAGVSLPKPNSSATHP